MTTDPITNPLNGSHKLAAFWYTFLTYVTTHFNWPTDKVYFEICNEPFVDFSLKTWGNYDFDFQFRPVFQSTLAQWRSIQLNALRTCLQTAPGYKYIVTTGIVDSRELRPSSSPTFDQQNSNWGTHDLQVPRFGAPYSVEELTDAGQPTSQGQTRRLNVIYNVHEYQPIKYTHFGPNALNLGLNYVKERDFLGLGLNPPPTGYLYWDYVMDGLTRIAGWQQEYSEGSFAGPGMWLTTYIPPVMMTEGGVRIRQLSAQCEPGVICDATPSDTEKIEREQWHYDITHELSNRGIGYSIYEFVGDMTMYINNTTTSGFPVQIHSYLSASKPIHAHGTQAKMDPYMFAAIFGNVRPTNPR